MDILFDWRCITNLKNINILIGVATVLISIGISYGTIKAETSNIKTNIINLDDKYVKREEHSSLSAKVEAVKEDVSEIKADMKQVIRLLMKQGD